MRFKGKIAIVTGAARGIGKEIALKFAQEGASVVICDIKEELLDQAKVEFKTKGFELTTFHVDVTNTKDVDDMVNKTLDKFKKIDILTNNAGITRDTLLVRMKEADWDAVLGVNLKGTFTCTKAVCKIMMKQRSGRIVNIASIIGIIGNAGQANYAASKGGIIAFTKSVAREMAPRGVNVNAIAPGFVETEMTKVLPEDIKATMLKAIPLAKFGKPGDVADLVLFLTGEESSYITGQVIKIDGGMAM